MAEKLLTHSLKKDLLAQMIRIRQLEEKIVEVYGEGHMRTPSHLSIGQEAVSVGVCQVLKEGDQIFASHRCHAAFLARGGTTESFFAELCGRAAGSNNGRGGSAHLAFASGGMYASPILGAMIPVAVGAALAAAMDHSKQISVAFLGDAAIEEGVFAESLNFAIIKKLPVFFVCENNLYSTHAHIRDRQPACAIYRRVAGQGIATKQLDGNDVEKVYTSALAAIQACRRGTGPVFLEYLTYRYREHVGPLYDYDKGYRTKKEVEAWQKKCPIEAYRKKLIRQKISTEQEFIRLQQQFSQEAERAYRKALESPFPEPATLLDHVY